MQKEMTVKEFESIVSKMNEIEPIILKRENKKDLIVISLEQYQRETFYNKLEKSKKEYAEGKTHDARTVFKELKEKYEY